MRVAFLVSAFPVISETFILDQVTGLIDRGCEVTIFADEAVACPALEQVLELVGDDRRRADDLRTELAGGEPPGRLAERQPGPPGRTRR